MAIITLRTTRMRWVTIAKSLAPPVAWRWLHKRLVVGDLPDRDLYEPNYSPWLAPEFRALFERVSRHTVVSIERCWTIWQALGQALNVEGEVMETGVFQGGTALLIRERMKRADIGNSKQLYLFDSFEGMKKVSASQDRHSEADFSDTSVEGVRAVVGDDPSIHFRKGWVPETFAGLEDRRFCFAHIDLDLYEGVRDALAFVYPRMRAGGAIVFDDYGFASCPGARRAVDDFFADKGEQPLALLTGQALVTKL